MKILNISSILNTGSPLPRHDDVVVKDGHVVYGIGKFSEDTGELKRLLELYCRKKGMFGQHLEFYIPLIARGSLPENRKFLTLLEDCARTDPLMVNIQDEMLKNYDYSTACFWADSNRFKLPLSLLVILEVYKTTGSILTSIPYPMKEPVPVYGGHEKRWVEAYLENQHKTDQKLGYTRNYKLVLAALESLVEQHNWNLEPPIKINGISI